MKNPSNLFKAALSEGRHQLGIWNTIGGNTPERFQEALAMTKRRLLSKPDGPRILNINCWNEWTEGSYLEPDTVHGLKYLELADAISIFFIEPLILRFFISMSRPLF